MKKIIAAAALAVTATAAHAGDRWNDPYRHCGYYMTVEWIGDHTRIQETRNRCTDRLIERQVDGPQPRHPQPHRPHHSSNNDAAAIMFGVILGTILSQN